MSSNSQRLAAAETRRKNWRIALGTIIAITIPFYCAGLFLWGTAPQRTPTPTPTTPGPQVVTATLPDPTATPLGGFFPSVTPLGITPQFPTQDSGFPTQVMPTLMVPTRFLSPTPQIIIPTNPPPPTNPPVPTNPPPPTQPAITNTPLPFDN
ncbi:MAG: hypothetical protein LCI00_21525 [Chloroflexi bacterium]|nr:hypothetical protein [Chloroflexota bacterium]MCC6895024.1 hypothetical protein [Anaerolineae bacterium]